MKFEEINNNYNCCLNDVDFANQESIVKFTSAEETWFWFCKYNGKRDGFKRNSSARIVARPCVLDDIYILVSRLYFAGKIGKEHLVVLLKYGKKQIIPDPRIFEEAEDAHFWREAMSLMEPVLVNKGIVEDKTRRLGMNIDVENMEITQ